MIDRFDLHLARAAMTVLEAAGISLRLGEDGKVYAGPAGKLTPELRQLITRHRDGMQLELSPPSERELILRLNEYAAVAEDAVSRIYELEAALASEKGWRRLYEQLAGMAMDKQDQPANPIPADIHRLLLSFAHPDRASPERQSAATRATKWLNAQPRGTARH